MAALLKKYHKEMLSDIGERLLAGESLAQIAEANEVSVASLRAKLLWEGPEFFVMEMRAFTQPKKKGKNKKKG